VICAARINACSSMRGRIIQSAGQSHHRESGAMLEKCAPERAGTEWPVGADLGHAGRESPRIGAGFSRAARQDLPDSRPRLRPTALDH
jgi:hypothetical protein